ncbi:hypothetical protein RIE95_10200 [Acidithiobacillus thiooxidans]|uniref:hypothetical protein n=1 Tax=Acidithiobacillus thiooxidans TaxID=930 RepID=UPI002858A80A|nr:hypothetical protein [Acidithiobacillus thiooxidans]MDR7927344.1 hypothetical protein [Acidithiobacillus thiooxidans]
MKTANVKIYTKNRKKNKEKQNFILKNVYATRYEAEAWKAVLEKLDKFSYPPRVVCTDFVNQTWEIVVPDH